MSGEAPFVVLLTVLLLAEMSLGRGYRLQGAVPESVRSHDSGDTVSPVVAVRPQDPTAVPHRDEPGLYRASRQETSSAIDAHLDAAVLIESITSPPSYGPPTD